MLIRSLMKCKLRATSSNNNLSIFFSRRKRSNGVDFAILIGWVAAVGYQIGQHVMWRDEVRALTIALNGDNMLAMLQGLHGEGHPAIWYLLLRAAHDLFGSVEVLPGVAFMVALITVALLIFRSPFPRSLVVIIIVSNYLLFEYVVIARNYEISVLFLFAIAAGYQTWRTRGVVLGLLLFLLANTNVMAAISVGTFLLFWLLDLLEETALRWTPQLTNFALNALIATIGVVVCGLTMLPTYNDAAVLDWSASSPIVAAAKAIFNPGGHLPLFPAFMSPLGSVLLFGSTLGLLTRRPAFVAAFAGLLLSALFMAVAATGGYRHAAVWLSFLIALYWICWNDIVKNVSGASKTWVRSISCGGAAAFLLLMGVQSALGLRTISAQLRGRNTIASRSADLGRLISSRSDLSNAVIVGEPEYLVEPLAYYIPNRTYLIREHRFGNVVKFSKSGQIATDLGETLRVSRELQRVTDSPVIILMFHRLDQITPNQLYNEGYNWTFRASTEQIREFLDQTTMIRRFEPAATDESFDVYLLK